MKKTFELTVDEITDACHLYLVHHNRWPNVGHSRITIQIHRLAQIGMSREWLPPKGNDIAAIVKMESVEDEQQHKQ